MVARPTALTCADKYAEVKRCLTRVEEAFLEDDQERERDEVIQTLRAMEAMLGLLMYDITGRGYGSR